MYFKCYNFDRLSRPGPGIVLVYTYCIFFDGWEFPVLDAALMRVLNANDHYLPLANTPIDDLKAFIDHSRVPKCICAGLS